MNFSNTLEFAKQLDEQDTLKHFRERFYIPMINDKESIYFTGNSLGLQPKTTQDYVLNELEDWANYGVEGHFHARTPWVSYHEIFPDLLADIVGAMPEEIVVMNQLTVNLHLLMTSFYRPTKERFKIICEAKAFPSDQYVFQSQANIHGLKPEDVIIEVFPRAGSSYIDKQDILDTIKAHGNETALVIFGGVNYYSGQVFNMQEICKVAHEVGAYCGFDLAHAAGNIALELHDWNVDFACWCSYKYMNSGPGNASGCFIHEKHHNDDSLPRFAGWWGHNKARRFKMEPNFEPVHGADGWQISNLPILSLAPYLASVELFAEVGMEALITKRNQITGYLEFILHEIDNEVDSVFEIITPTNPEERASQLSVFFHGQGRPLFEYLMNNGVVTDWREPNVIRFAPVPLYCSFEDMYDFGQILKAGILGKI